MNTFLYSLLSLKHLIWNTDSMFWQFFSCMRQLMFAQHNPHRFQKGKKVVWGLCFRATLSLFSCHFVIFIWLCVLPLMWPSLNATQLCCEHAC